MNNQRSEGWFKDRLGKATASNFAAIMAGPKYAGWKNYKASLILERLTGEKADGFTSPAMQWGIDTEPLAILAYEAETGLITTEAPFVEHKVLLAGASPDRYVEEDGLVEVKCPNSATHLYTLMLRRMPPQYKAQTQGQLWVTERQWNDFVSFDPRMPDNAQLFIERQQRDEPYITLMEETVTKFLDEVEEEYQKVKDYKVPALVLNKIVKEGVK